jgi:predicted nucleic acid-binding protein
MAAVARYLADTSAITRFPHTEVAAELGPLVADGVLATCGVIDLELRYSARGSAAYTRIAATRRESFAWLSTEDIDLHRALAIQTELAERGLHRTAWPELLIAAVAERHGVTVLHYDAEYDLIAEITGQSVAWVVPKGSLS